MPRIDRSDTNITLPAALVEEARSLGIDVSQACVRGVAAEITATRRRQWLDENKEAFDAWNDYVAKNGLALEQFRPF